VLCPLDGCSLAPFSRTVDYSAVMAGDGREKGLRVERVQFETDRLRIVGDMTLPTQGYQSRFSDALNRAEVPFVPLVDVEVTSLEDGRVEKYPFLVVAKAHVRIAFPVD
jgi:uncharacterized protein DUF6812